MIENAQHSADTSAPAAKFGGWRFPRRATLVVGLALLLTIGALAYFLLDYGPRYNEFNTRIGVVAGGYPSDLYARWYGSRELFLHGTDPYSAASTAAMQRGFYGRDPRPGETLSAFAVFAHPLYTAFVIAPLVALDFDLAQRIATVLFPLLIALGAILWLRAARPTAPLWQMGAVGLLAVSSMATLQDAYLQQLSAPVFFFMADAVFLVTRRRYAWAGVLLAASAIKPQESVLLIVALGLWALLCWRERKGLACGFAATMALFEIGSEILRPGWLFSFLANLRDYSQQYSNANVLSAIFPTWILATAALCWALAILWRVWRLRQDAPNSYRLVFLLATTLVVQLILIPTFELHQRIYLLPALIALTAGLAQWPHGHKRAALVGGVLPLLLAPWLGSAGLGLLELVGLQPDGDTLALAQNIPWFIYIATAPIIAPALLAAMTGQPAAVKQEQTGAILQAEQKAA